MYIIPKESPLYFTSTLVLGIGQAWKTVRALEEDRSQDNSSQIAIIRARQIYPYSKMAVNYMQLESVGFHCAFTLWREWNSFMEAHFPGKESSVLETNTEKNAIMDKFFKISYPILLDEVIAPIVDTQARLTDELSKNPTDQALITRVVFFDQLNTQLLTIVKNAVNTFIDDSSTWTSPQAQIKSEVTKLLTDASKRDEVTKVRNLLGYSLKVAGTFAFGFIAVGGSPPEMLRGSKYTRSEKAVLYALSAANYSLKVPKKQLSAHKAPADFSLSFEDSVAHSGAASSSASRPDDRKSFFPE